MKHILVTGNMGYVGPAVIKRLRQAFPGAHLSGFDIGYFAHCLTGTATLPEHRVDTQHFGDIRKFPAALLDGVDAIVNLAAISNDPMGNAFEQVTMDINCYAAAELAKLARERGVGAFVFASSCSVYGFAEGGARREEDPLNPLTAYARSKIETEEHLADLGADDFRVTCLRFPTACGMSERLRLDLVLNDFVAAAIASGEIEILSDGTPWRPLIDTQDMARAIEWAIGRDAAPGGFLAINAGHNGINYQVVDLAKRVQARLPGISININENAAPDKRSYQVNFDLYEKLAPNHLPQVDLDQSIAELCAGLQGMNFATVNFRESENIRLRVLNRHLEDGRLDSDLCWAEHKRVA
ncbi:MAG: SDR family oxidoreductase [Pseudomonadota bacterium]